MRDRFRTRRGVVVLAGTLSAFAVLPVAADSQIPGSDALKPTPAVPDVLGRAGNDVDALKRRASGTTRSDSGDTRPAAPQQSTPATSVRPAPRRAAAPSRGAVRRRATSSGSGNHAGVTAPTAHSSGGQSARTAAKAGTAQAPASDGSPAAHAAARPTAVSPGSNVQNDPGLPFTGSRPLDVLALGLLAFAVGLAARWTLRRWQHAHA